MRLADILKDLREDHRNMQRMLDLLEREIERIHLGEDADYEMLHDIMRYLTVYADAVHHPKENIIFRALAGQPGLAPELERVGHEHRDIAELGAMLRNDIGAIASGAAVTRERIETDSTDYLRFQRRHMAWEEEDLFRRVDRLVTADNEAFIDIAELESPDPVFGPARHHSFANLLQSIRDLSDT
jgi:hemerythrin-like domain-containing protein